MELTIDTPIQYVPRVGPAMAGKLRNLAIETVRDLLYHIPFRYNDFSRVTPIARVQPGETVTVIATVESLRAFVTKTHKRIQQALVADESGKMTVIWFNQPYLLRVIKPGDRIHLSGPVGWFGTTKVLSVPEYEILTDEGASSLHTGRIVPVYPGTAGVSSKWMRGRIAFLLSEILPGVTDPLPDDIREQHALVDLNTALAHVHFPPDLDAVAQARRRIAFDEVFLLQLRAYEQKRAWERTERAVACAIHRQDVTGFIRSLPFALTDDQARAVEEIATDLARSVPMNRLLVGDVGAGKTVVSALAMFLAAKNKKRSVCMAPTQILAEQHFQTLTQILEPLGVSVGLVTAAKKIRERTADVLVGTHALLSKRISLTRVGLIVVDEQQRFGVDQRSALRTKRSDGTTPHFLTMTATPIPRTMAKTMLGAVELSVLATLPLGRKTVKTWVVPAQKRTGAYAWIEKTMRATGGQVFVVCPLIEESENVTAVRAVVKEAERIRKIFPNRTVGLLHGKLASAEKNRVLDAFHRKTYDILVTTPVVEVGIDVPNASVMLIEAAERFGLANLHQLRGRVGRGSAQSYCLLFTDAGDEAAVSRLKSLETVHSGPLLAEIDLKLRGPGEVFGVRQHGMPKLKIASFTDMALVDETQETLHAITKKDPDLSGFPQLQEYAKKSTILPIPKD